MVDASSLHLVADMARYFRIEPDVCIDVRSVMESSRDDSLAVTASEHSFTACGSLQRKSNSARKAGAPKPERDASHDNAELDVFSHLSETTTWSWLAFSPPPVFGTWLRKFLAVVAYSFACILSAMARAGRSICKCFGVLLIFGCFGALRSWEPELRSRREQKRDSREKNEKT